jgi:hypothetical protein
MCITQQPCHRTLLTSLLQMPSFLDSSIRTSVSRSNHPAKPTSNVDHSRCTIMSIPSVMSYVDPQSQLVNVIGVSPSPLTVLLLFEVAWVSAPYTAEGSVYVSAECIIRFNR